MLPEDGADDAACVLVAQPPRDVKKRLPTPFLFFTTPFLFHQGQIGYGFLLKDHNKTVRVLGLGRAAVQNGEQVIVEGIFYRLRQVGRASAYNEIKANHIRSLARLNPDFVG